MAHIRDRLKTAGRQLKIQTVGCNWCRSGTLPVYTEQKIPTPDGSYIVRYSGGLCELCASKFSKLLCSRKWQKFRKAILEESPYCAMCSYSTKDTLMHDIEHGSITEEKQLIVASVIDHKIPWRFRPDLFWQQDNLQSLCRNCHDIKTIAEQTWSKS